jgi:hypothetical protein
MSLLAMPLVSADITPFWSCVNTRDIENSFCPGLVASLGA